MSHESDDIIYIIINQRAFKSILSCVKYIIKQSIVPVIVLELSYRLEVHGRIRQAFQRFFSGTDISAFVFSRSKHSYGEDDGLERIGRP